MIRFIWQNWWRRKDRFILLIIGAFIISAGLTYLIGLSESNQGTIVDNLQQRWTASYDIVVRPDDSRSVTEDKGLMEPNYLSGLDGGISLEQYETIKDITNVDVAAPIAMIGYAYYSANYGMADLSEAGLYRKQTTKTADNGIEETTSVSNYYFPYNVWDILDKGPEYGVGSENLDLSFTDYALLAGVDPEQEARLVGLDEAIIEQGTSRYFDQTDTYYSYTNDDHHEFPIIVNQNTFVNKQETITYEKLDIEINDDNANVVMENIKENGGQQHLDTIDGETIETISATGEESFQRFVSEMTGINWETGEADEPGDTSIDLENNQQITGIAFQPSPLIYQEIASPSSDRWPYSYQVVPFQNEEDTVGVFQHIETFREPIMIAEEFIDYPQIKPHWIGFYDSNQLNISRDPMNELPMETYRPATAELVMDEAGNPENPPKQLQPVGDTYDFLTDPPGMLTTIEAAAGILGEEPISAIRIKVAGVSELTEESQEILDQVADEIEEKTGLITDITLGSSPQLALTYVPGINGGNDIGWLQQPWVNIGSSISIFTETKVGFSSIMASVIAVAIVYVWASGIVNLLARRKEFAVLLAIGWRPGQLNRLLLIESFIIGLFVACISWMMLGLVYTSSETVISFDRFLWTGLFGLIIYLLGSIIPILMTRKISSYEAMRTGEITGSSKRLFKAKGIYRMAFNHFIGKWKRSFLSIISIALPIALLAVFLYITFRLQGVMYTSVLGEYIAVEIGPAHYAAIMVALIIAILTTAEITWQNVSERREEIALLQSIGWRRSKIRQLILAEGLFSGLFAALFGLTLAFIIIWSLYQAFPGEELRFILLTGFIPVIIGIIGTILPAERAVRIVPSQGVSGNISNRKVVEKRLRWVVSFGAVLLVGTFVYTMVQVAPNIETADTTEGIERAYAPTEGEIVERTVNQKEDEDTESEEEVQETTYGVTELDFEFHESEINNGTTLMDGRFYLEVQEKESQLPDPEPGMKNVAKEFIIEVQREAESLNIHHHSQFRIIDGNEVYYPVDWELIEVEDWNDNRHIHGPNGKLHGILEYTVPEHIEDHGLLLRSNIGGNVFVWFD